MNPRRFLPRTALAAAVAACSSGGPTTTEPPPSPVTVMAITAPALPLALGGSATLVAVARDAAGSTVDTAAITWSSSDAGIVTVTSAGVVAGVAAGTATITARDGAVTAAVRVAVTASGVAALIVIGPADSLPIGMADALRLSALDGSGYPVVAPAVTWTSSNPAVATVSAAGVVTAVSRGASTITATNSTLTGTVVVLVKGPPSANLQIIGPFGPLLVGDTFRLRVSATDSAGQATAPPAVTWSSSLPDVATVSGTGLVTALASGVTTIVASAGALDARVTVTVGSVAAENVVVTGPPGPLSVGGTFQFSAVVRLADGTMVGGRPITWRSTDPDVATIGADGLVTALAPGVTTITATTGAITGQYALTVTGGAIAATILPAAGALLVAPGQTLQLTPIEYYLAPSALTLPPRQVTWSSDNLAVAAVSAAGAVTGVAPGTTTIRAMVDGNLAAQDVQVMTVPGTATIRLVSAANDYPVVTMHPNSGTTVSLPYGSTAEQTIAAGALQLSLDGITPLTSFYDAGVFGVQVFYGLVPAGSHQTFVAVSNSSYAAYSGPAAIAWLTDRIDPVPADSAAVRVLLATDGGYNVFFTPSGGAATLLTLQGCYLDWPFGYTDYSGRLPGDFDIVLQAGKFSSSGPEVARFHLTAPAGHAMTFIITGKDATSLHVIPITDR